MSLPTAMQASFENYLEEQSEELMQSFASTIPNEYERWLYENKHVIDAPNDFDDDVDLIEQFINEEDLHVAFSEYAKEKWRTTHTE